MDEKSTLPVPASATATESQTPTIAPSAASMTEDDKASGKGATTSETDAASTHPAVASGGETVEADNEKSANNELKQQATATSQHGSNIEPSRTREDGVAYPKGYELGLITLALCLSVFLIALGMSFSSLPSLDFPAHYD